MAGDGQGHRTVLTARNLTHVYLLLRCGRGCVGVRRPDGDAWFDGSACFVQRVGPLCLIHCGDYDQRRPLPFNSSLQGAGDGGPVLLGS